MKIVIFGLTITSAWGNGHATTFRSLVKALARRGHRVVFVEKDVEWYRSNRDLPEPDFCRLRLYDNWAASGAALVDECRDADAVVIGSYFPDGVPATEALLDAGCGPLLFYDIDTPITLAALRLKGSTDYLDARLIPQYDAYLSFSGGPCLDELENRFGAKRACAFYCSVDADLYAPASVREEFQCDLSYLGTYAPDRQEKLMRLLNQPASLLPSHRFVVAGSMYPDDTPWQANVARQMHVPPPDHPEFYSSGRFTLNLTRADMVAAGYSPSVRLFEASACAAAILSDTWEGLGDFLQPGEQILVPRDEYEVRDILLHLPDGERLKIGRNARERILAEHTSAHRALQFEDIVSGLSTHPERDRRGSRGIETAEPAEGLPAHTPLYTAR